MNSNSLSSNNSINSGTEIDLPSHYALRVALQTMKERCITLQQRLTVIEEENSILRTQMPVEKNSENFNILRGCQSDIDNFRKQIEELNVQKLQLNEHITMVSSENRQLWSRLSQLAKDNKFVQKNNQLQNSSATEINNDGQINEQQQLSKSTSGQNLIRSRTFTQHSPNPLLRQKHLAAAVTATTNNKSLEDISLQEISLKDNHDITDNVTSDIRSRREIQKNNNSLGFGYLNDDSTDGSAGDVEIETKKCIDNMFEIKNEVLKQSEDLNEILNALKEKKELIQECLECKQRNTNKLELVDKMIETDDDLIGAISFSVGNSLSSTLPLASLHQQNFKLKSNESETAIMTGHKGANNKTTKNEILIKNDTHIKQLDLIEAKIQADELDKICPICGRIFSKDVLFDDFEIHVENHFIDDNINLSDYENQFEIISQNVGNF